jgi:hypothetical protein
MQDRNSDDQSKTELAAVADASPEVDFAIVLSRVIADVTKNPAELRNAIYDLARIRLKQEAWERTPSIGILETRRLSLALETAIERVEAISIKQDQRQAIKSLEHMIENLGERSDPSLTPPSTGYPLIEISPGNPSRLFTPEPNEDLESVAPNAKSASPGLRRSIFITMAASLLAIAALGGATGLLKFELFGPKTNPENGIQKSAAAEPVSRSLPSAINDVDGNREQVSPTSSDRNADIPLPQVYGIYALSGGKLYELEPLPGRVPDRRVFMSAMITKPSRTVVPDGRVSFLAYRRDLATAAPSRIAVRVIAKVQRAMTFDPAGKVEVAAVDDSWTIRNIEYDLRVSPLSNNPEMILIKPETADFVLSPGRYGMVLNNIAYDFFVSGDAADSVHCLERTVAANGVFYSQCRSP